MYSHIGRTIRHVATYRGDTGVAQAAMSTVDDTLYAVVFRACFTPVTQLATPISTPVSECTHA